MSGIGKYAAYIILVDHSLGVLCINNDHSVVEALPPKVMPVTIPYEMCEQHDYFLGVELSSAVPYLSYELKPYCSPPLALLRVGTGLGGCGPNWW